MGDLEEMSLTLFGDKDIFDAGEENLEGKKEALSRIRKALLEGRAISKERNTELKVIEAKIKS